MIRERIAASGIGTVYLAHDRVKQRLTALKLLPAPHGYSAEKLQALARQVNLQEPPAHPFIAEMYETGVTQDGKLFVASEYVSG